MILGLALALALADSASPAPLPEPAAQQISPAISLSEAGHAIAAGRLDQAKAMLAIAVAAGAKGDPVDRLLADLALARGENEQALNLYKALLGVHPDDGLLLERGGIAALRLGRATEATALLDRATRVPAASWRAWNARGAAADRQGRWAEADAAYARAAAIDPKRAEVPNNQGWSLMLRGQWAEALIFFQRASAIDPALPRLANNLELARAAVGADLPARMRGESDEAYAARLNDAGVVAAADGQTKRAEAAFAQAIELRSRWYARAAENLAALGVSK
ncbi:tetratricopeptide repeat protein [Sphingomonas sp. G124]|uniref:Tetratricopeptide repeat protein n=1 Tax=Sphingomonas cremea TaxID=2904799 RepID=A0A9X1TW22_9SPHN|nr:tetratricopeptide repeat protein [Sphingomonas cremea]MCF2514809.1 tetratricopeptide repeat protein [Sphingomonas cremea]